jgi:tripartite-type tricarboxylate transporter receptor subunit TctC
MPKPEVDFERISIVSAFAMVILARKDFPPNDLNEFASFVKANSNKLNVAHAGVGSIFFTTRLLLNSILDANPTSVPFNGGGPAMNALVAGQVDYMCGDVPTSVSQLRAGTIKAYAVGGALRNPMLPDVPTSKKAGLPEFRVSGWTALFAPKTTPKPIIDKLAVALDRALDDATTRKRLLEWGSDIPDKTSRGPQSIARLVKSEIAKWNLANVKIGVSSSSNAMNGLTSGPRTGPPGPSANTEHLRSNLIISNLIIFSAIH